MVTFWGVPHFPGLILLFYLLFYGFLAGLFSLTMWVMLQSVDPHVPKYQDRLTTPGEFLHDWLLHDWLLHDGVPFLHEGAELRPRCCWGGGCECAKGGRANAW